jgi:hypothetical protein
LREADAGKPAQAFMQDSLGHRRRAVGNELQAGEIVGVEVGQLQHHGEHGRNEGRYRHLVLRDGLQHVIRCEAWNDDMPATHQGSGIDARSGSEMKQRPGVKRDRRLVEPQSHGCHNGIDPEIAMAEHHALGPARGSSGVEETGQIIAASQRILTGLGLRHQGFVVVYARQAIRMRRRRDDRANAGAGIGDLHGGVQECAVAHEDGRLGILDLLDHLGNRKSGIDRHDNAARP